VVASNVASAYEMNLYNIFFYCYYERIFWGLTHIAFNISLPLSVQHMFGTWINHAGGKLKWQLLAGASAFCWVIWLSRNDVVFE
jgi:hypothetical protein